MKLLIAAAVTTLASLAACAVSAQTAPTREQMLRQLTQPPTDAVEVDCTPGSPTADAPGCRRKTRGWSLPGARTTAPGTPTARPSAPAPTRAAAPRERRRVTNDTEAAVQCVASEVSGGGLNLCVTFALGSAQLTSTSRQSLDTLASILTQELATQRLIIEGHADARGRADTNLTLSRARAEAVVAYLTRKGVPAARLQAEGYGADRPISGRAPTDPMNRRVQARLAT